MDQTTELPPGLAGALPYNSLQRGIVIAFAVTYFFCTLLLGLRYFQAIKLVRRIELDLIILTLAYGAALVYFVTMVNLMGHGWGRHITELNTTDLIEFNKGLLPNTLTYLITPAVTKLAMLTVLFKINSSVVYRCVVVAVGVSLFAYTLTLTAITGGPCSPLKSGTTTCLTNVALAQAILNIISDLAVIAIPIPTIHSLQFGIRQRMTVGCLFSVGSLVVICSIARLPYTLLITTDADVTYTEAILGVWSIVEVNLGVMCGAAMRLKPLIVQYLPQLGIFSSRRTGQSKSHGSWGATNELRTDERDVRHTYQLHSVQNGSSGPPGDDGNIHVNRECELRHIDQGRGSDFGRTRQFLD